MARPVSIGMGVNEAPVFLTPEQRSTHMQVIGASGRGKTKFLEQMIRQDIEHRHGLCLIDPHGTLYSEMVAWCARYGLHRRRRIHLIDPNDPEWTVGFDPLRHDDPEQVPLAVDAAVEVCAQVWGGEDTNRTPLLKKCLRAIFYALAVNGRPFGDAMKLVVKKDPEGFRAALTNALPNEVYQLLWDDLNALRAASSGRPSAAPRTAWSSFLGNPVIQRMMSVKEKALDLRRCMDDGDIILVNLRPLNISADNARLVGTLLTNGLFNAAIRRDERVAKRKPFYLYIDECYQYLSSDVEAMLDQTRKFGLHLTLVHHHLSQLTHYGDQIYKAVMTNAQTKVVFGGVPDEDGEILARELLRETFDYNQPKELLNKPVVVGFERVLMNSEGWADGKAITEGSSIMTADMSGMAMMTGTAQTFGADGLPIGGGSASATEAATSGTSQGHGSMTAISESAVRSRGQAEALMPILEERPTSLMSQDEILHRAILAIRKLPQRGFFLTRPYDPPMLLATPKVEDPMVSPRRVAAFIAGTREKSIFTMRREEATALIDQRRSEETFIDDDDDDDDAYSVPEP